MNAPKPSHSPELQSHYDGCLFRLTQYWSSLSIQIKKRKTARSKYAGTYNLVDHDTDTGISVPVWLSPVALPGYQIRCVWRASWILGRTTTRRLARIRCYLSHFLKRKHRDQPQPNQRSSAKDSAIPSQSSSVPTYCESGRESGLM